MNPHRGFHRRFSNKRQHLGGVLASLLAGSPTSTPVSQSVTPPAALDIAETTGETSVGVLLTLGLPSSSESSSTRTPSAPLTSSSSNSTGSTTPSASTTTTSSILSTTSTSTRTSTTSTTPTPTPTPTSTLIPTPTPSVSETVYASSDGTRIVYITSTLPAASGTAAPTSFLQNAPLAGGIFALVGIIALVIIFVIVTCVIRKRRRNRLERDTAAAVTFDPGATDPYEHHNASIEKRRISASSSGHGHGYDYGYGIRPAYAPPQEYHGPTGYGQYSAAAYPAPVPHQAPSPTVPQPAAQGGANLTRKYSDRKPVPPLLPDHTYDPSNTHVSIPPQFSLQ